MTGKRDEQTECPRHDDPSRQIHHRLRSSGLTRRLLAARAGMLGLALLAGSTARADEVIPRASTGGSSQTENTVGAPSASTGLITGQLYRGNSASGATDPSTLGGIMTPAGDSPVSSGLALDPSEMPFQPSTTPRPLDRTSSMGEAAPRTASGRKAPLFPADGSVVAGSPGPSDVAFDSPLNLYEDKDLSGPISTIGPDRTDSTVASGENAPTWLAVVFASPGALILVMGLTVAAALAGRVIHGRRGRVGHRSGDPPTRGRGPGTVFPTPGR